MKFNNYSKAEVISLDNGSFPSSQKARQISDAIAHCCRKATAPHYGQASMQIMIEGVSRGIGPCFSGVTYELELGEAIMFMSIDSAVQTAN